MRKRLFRAENAVFVGNKLLGPVGFEPTTNGL